MKPKLAKTPPAPLFPSTIAAGRVRVVMGIDPSLRSSGWASVIDTETGFSHESGTIATPAMDKPAELNFIYHTFVDLLGMALPDLVVIEGYAYGASHHREVLAEVGGVLRLALHSFPSIPVLTVPPQTLKKFVLPASSKLSGKDGMLLGVYRKYGAEFPTADECDAYALARLGHLRASIDAGHPRTGTAHGIRECEAAAAAVVLRSARYGGLRADSGRITPARRRSRP